MSISYTETLGQVFNTSSSCALSELVIAINTECVFVVLLSDIIITLQFATTCTMCTASDLVPNRYLYISLIQLENSTRCLTYLHVYSDGLWLYEHLKWISWIKSKKFGPKRGRVKNNCLFLAITVPFDIWPRIQLGQWLSKHTQIIAPMNFGQRSSRSPCGVKIWH